MFNILRDESTNYGATTSRAKSKASSIIYCVHGKIAKDCCDTGNVEISTLKPNDCE